MKDLCLIEPTRNARMSIDEIADRLSIGERAVYSMLERGILPGIRVGKRWIVTRHAYEQWERMCGLSPATALCQRVEVTQ